MPGLGGDVLEAQRSAADVAKQLIARQLARASLQRPALHQPNVQAAVAVEIEHRGASADDLRQPELARHAVAVLEIEPRLAGDLDETRALCGRRQTPRREGPRHQAPADDAVDSDALANTIHGRESTTNASSAQRIDEWSRNASLNETSRAVDLRLGGCEPPSFVQMFDLSALRRTSYDDAWPIGIAGHPRAWQRQPSLSARQQPPAMMLMPWRGRSVESHGR